MRNNRLARALLLTVVWTYAVATWASISHHLLGMPDLVLPAAVAAAVGVPSWTFRRRWLRTAGSATPQQAVATTD